MTTSFEHEAHKDPDLLEQEINAKREHISDLVDALEQRLSPGQMVDRVLAYAKGNGGEFFENLGTTLKNNPVPATLTVLGLAWLGLNQNRPFNPGPAHHGPGLGEKLGDAVDTSLPRSGTGCAGRDCCQSPDDAGVVDSWLLLARMKRDTANPIATLPARNSAGLLLAN